MIVYLAGPIADSTDQEAGDWRRDAAVAFSIYGVVTIDPFRLRDYRGKRNYNPAEVVEADKADINRSNMILANCHKVSVGTSQEVLYAWERNKEVLIIHPDPVGASPWLRYHCEKMVSNLTEAMQWFTTQSKWGRGVYGKPNRP